jgi:DNA primase
MVVSISKIPDRIQREIYIQECSRIMDISEQVLINIGAIAEKHY